MPIEIVSKNNNSSEQPRYIPIVEAKIPKESLVRENDSGRIIPSKTLVINELNVTITQNFDEDVDFRIDTWKEFYEIVQELTKLKEMCE